jgi:hypothetical protein
LFRQAAFKGEPLVPVVPTAFAVILIPDAAAAACSKDPPALAAATSRYVEGLFAEDPEAAARVFRWVDFTLICTRAEKKGEKERERRMGAVLFADASRLAAEDPSALADVYGDSGNVILDLVDATIRCAHPFDAATSQQFAVCLPCDPRPVSFESSPTAWYALPTCLSCLDRLERSVSGLAVRAGGPCRCADGVCFCHARRGIGCSCCNALRSLTRDVGPHRKGAALACGGCGVVEDLWGCLVCGEVGCSRYRAEHAKQHWEGTGHQFALSLVSQQIWDYAADSLAHRLIVAFDSDEHGGAAQPFVVPDRDADLGEGSPSVAAKLRSVDVGQPNASASAPAAAASDESDAGFDEADAFERLTMKPGDKKKTKAKGKGASNTDEGGGSRAWSHHGAALPNSFLVDAKLESKVEELCLEYSRLLSTQLESQRRHLAATFQLADDAAATETMTTASFATTAATSGPTPAIATEATAYAAFDAAATRASAKWGVATNATVAVVNKAAALEAETSTLEAEEVALTKKQEALKAAVHASLLKRHEAATAKKKRVAELKEMIAEAELNLQARKRVEARGLSAADQASSFTVAMDPSAAGGAGRPGARRRRG